MDIEKKILESDSEARTIAHGEEFAKGLRAGDVLALIGPLGGGKTHFVKGLAQGLGLTGYVKSPSYTIVNIYEAQSGKGYCCQDVCETCVDEMDRGLDLYHIDLYRLAEGDLFETGVEEYIHGEGISAVEWAERAPEVLEEARFILTFSYDGEDNRLIEIEEKIKN